jgi:hypothetical protein
MTTAESNAAWSSKAIAGATTAVDYDYNCDGSEEKRFPTSYISTSASCSLKCVGSPIQICSCVGSNGYTGAVPACGASSSYTSCGKFTLGCQRVTTTSKAQECR